jgi:hypothetical protein
MCRSCLGASESPGPIRRWARQPIERAHRSRSTKPRGWASEILCARRSPRRLVHYSPFTLHPSPLLPAFRPPLASCLLKTVEDPPWRENFTLPGLPRSPPSLRASVPPCLRAVPVPPIPPSAFVLPPFPKVSPSIYEFFTWRAISAIRRTR